MKKLKLFEEYTREDVFNIFSDGSIKFTKGSGNWGMHGIVKIPKRKNDYVFFVTIGQDKLGVEFKEEISNEGILTWQSQKRHDLEHPTIKTFINHDDLVDNIYLFLRSKSNEHFLFRGRLAYHSHDVNSNNPVHFKWRLLDWNKEEKEIQGMLIKENSNGYSIANEEIPRINKLIETKSPELKDRKNRHSNYNANPVDFITKNKDNHKLGFEGELLVLSYIKNELVKIGRLDLAKKVVHTSFIEGDGAGYDIKAYKEDGSELYIEVKTTKGGINSEFFISPNELAFSDEFSNNYQLIRVYEFDSKLNSGKFYKIEGNLKDKLYLKPTQFRASICE